MSDALTFLKDWLPSLAIIIGGVWVLVNWLIQRGKDGRRDVAALFGEMSVKASRLSENKYFVEVISDWENTSPASIMLDPTASRIELFVVDSDLSVGVYLPSHHTGDIITSHLPFEGFSKYEMEPNTKSRVQTNYILEKGKTYLVRVILYLSPVIEGKPATSWHRESVIDLSSIDEQNEEPSSNN